jgi:hypothetical protein
MSDQPRLVSIDLTHLVRQALADAARTEASGSGTGDGGVLPVAADAAADQRVRVRLPSAHSPS